MITGLDGPFLSGFALGGSLIVAIGAQNAFVLRQGLQRRHVFAVALVCSLSDAALIWSGAYLLAAITGEAGVLATAARYGGAAFLGVYGLLAARRAFATEALGLTGQPEASLGRALVTCLAFTLLNPHVYLDTVVLVGSIASQYAASARVAFCLGASSASFLWFFGLGYGARLLVPLFAKPLAWRILDAIIATIMLTIGLQLALGG